MKLSRHQQSRLSFTDFVTLGECLEAMLQNPKPSLTALELKSSSCAEKLHSVPLTQPGEIIISVFVMHTSESRVMTSTMLHKYSCVQLF